MSKKRTPGRQISVGAMPRSYQVTPEVLDGDGRQLHKRSAERPNRVESARSRQGPSTTRLHERKRPPTLSLRFACKQRPRARSAGRALRREAVGEFRAVV